MTSYKYLPDFIDKLSISDKNYADYLAKLFELYLQSDRSSILDFIDNTDIEAVVLLKSDNVVVAGLEEVKFLLADYFDFDFFAFDGEVCNAKNVFRIKGKIHDVLNLERFMLDILSKMSQVATVTAQAMAITNGSGIKPAATRKSLLNPILKKAVHLGGGVTHRLNLKHAMIVKDNFKTEGINNLLGKLSVVDYDFSALDFVEFEVETLDEIDSVVKYLGKANINVPIGIMLDNFSPDLIEAATKKIKDSNLVNFVEVSGGISLLNLEQYLFKGIDIVSMSSLFTSGSYPDFSLELLKK